MSNYDYYKRGKKEPIITLGKVGKIAGIVGGCFTAFVAICIFVLYLAGAFDAKKIQPDGIKFNLNMSESGDIQMINNVEYLLPKIIEDENGNKSFSLTVEDALQSIDEDTDVSHLEKANQLDISVDIDNEDVIKVKTANCKLGEPIEFEVCKTVINGRSYIMGGFATITVRSSDGVYGKDSIKVFIDSPVESITNNVASKNTVKGNIDIAGVVQNETVNVEVNKLFIGDELTVAKPIYEPEWSYNPTKRQGGKNTKEDKLYGYVVEYREQTLDNSYRWMEIGNQGTRDEDKIVKWKNNSQKNTLISVKTGYFRIRSYSYVTYEAQEAGGDVEGLDIVVSEDTYYMIQEVDYASLTSSASTKQYTLDYCMKNVTSEADAVTYRIYLNSKKPEARLAELNAVNLKLNITVPKGYYQDENVLKNALANVYLIRDDETMSDYSIVGGNDILDSRGKIVFPKKDSDTEFETFKEYYFEIKLLSYNPKDVNFKLCLDSPSSNATVSETIKFAMKDYSSTLSFNSVTKEEAYKTSAYGQFMSMSVQRGIVSTNTGELEMQVMSLNVDTSYTDELRHFVNLNNLVTNKSDVQGKEPSYWLINYYLYLGASESSAEAARGEISSQNKIENLDSEIVQLDGNTYGIKILGDGDAIESGIFVPKAYGSYKVLAVLIRTDINGEPIDNEFGYIKYRSCEMQVNVQVQLNAVTPIMCNDERDALGVEDVTLKENNLYYIKIVPDTASGDSDILENYCRYLQIVPMYNAEENAEITIDSISYISSEYEESQGYYARITIDTVPIDNMEVEFVVYYNNPNTEIREQFGKTDNSYNLKQTAVRSLVISNVSGNAEAKNKAIPEVSGKKRLELTASWNSDLAVVWSFKDAVNTDYVCFEGNKLTFNVSINGETKGASVTLSNITSAIAYEYQPDTSTLEITISDVIDANNLAITIYVTSDENPKFSDSVQIVLNVPTIEFRVKQDSNGKPIIDEQEVLVVDSSDNRIKRASSMTEYQKVAHVGESFDVFQYITTVYGANEIDLKNMLTYSFEFPQEVGGYAKLTASTVMFEINPSSAKTITVLVRVFASLVRISFRLENYISIDYVDVNNLFNEITESNYDNIIMSKYKNGAQEYFYPTMVNKAGVSVELSQIVRVSSLDANNNLVSVNFSVSFVGVNAGYIEYEASTQKLKISQIRGIYVPIVVDIKVSVSGAESYVISADEKYSSDTISTTFKMLLIPNLAINKVAVGEDLKIKRDTQNQLVQDESGIAIIGNKYYYEPTVYKFNEVENTYTLEKTTSSINLINGENPLFKIKDIAQQWEQLNISGIDTIDENDTLGELYKISKIEFAFSSKASGKNVNYTGFEIDNTNGILTVDPNAVFVNKTIEIYMILWIEQSGKYIETSATLNIESYYKLSLNTNINSVYKAVQIANELMNSTTFEYLKTIEGQVMAIYKDQEFRLANIFTIDDGQRFINDFTYNITQNPNNIIRLQNAELKGTNFGGISVASVRVDCQGAPIGYTLYLIVIANADVYNGYTLLEETQNGKIGANTKNITESENVLIDGNSFKLTDMYKVKSLSSDNSYVALNFSHDSADVVTMSSSNDGYKIECKQSAVDRIITITIDTNLNYLQLNENNEYEIKPLKWVKYFKLQASQTIEITYPYENDAQMFTDLYDESDASKEGADGYIRVKMYDNINLDNGDGRIIKAYKTKNEESIYDELFFAVEEYDKDNGWKNSSLYIVEHNAKSVTIPATFNNEIFTRIHITSLSGIDAYVNVLLSPDKDVNPTCNICYPSDGNSVTYIGDQKQYEYSSKSDLTSSGQIIIPLITNDTTKGNVTRISLESETLTRNRLILEPYTSLITSTAEVTIPGISVSIEDFMLVITKTSDYNKEDFVVRVKIRTDYGYYLENEEIVTYNIYFGNNVSILLNNNLTPGDINKRCIVNGAENEIDISELFNVVVINGTAVEITEDNYDVENLYTYYVVRNGSSYYYSFDSNYDDDDVVISNEAITDNYVTIGEQNVSLPDDGGCTPFVYAYTNYSITTVDSKLVLRLCQSANNVPAWGGVVQITLSYGNSSSEDYSSCTCTIVIFPSVATISNLAGNINSSSNPIIACGDEGFTIDISLFDSNGEVNNEDDTYISKDNLTFSFVTPDFNISQYTFNNTTVTPTQVEGTDNYSFVVDETTYYLIKHENKYYLSENNVYDVNDTQTEWSPATYTFTPKVTIYDAKDFTIIVNAINSEGTIVRSVPLYVKYYPSMHLSKVENENAKTKGELTFAEVYSGTTYDVQSSSSQIYFTLHQVSVANNVASESVASSASDVNYQFQLYSVTGEYIKDLTLDNGVIKDSANDTIYAKFLNGVISSTLSATNYAINVIASIGAVSEVGYSRQEFLIFFLANISTQNVSVYTNKSTSVLNSTLVPITLNSEINLSDYVSISLISTDNLSEDYADTENGVFSLSKTLKSFNYTSTTFNNCYDVLEVSEETVSKNEAYQSSETIVHSITMYVLGTNIGVVYISVPRDFIYTYDSSFVTMYACDELDLTLLARDLIGQSQTELRVENLQYKLVSTSAGSDGDILITNNILSINENQNIARELTLLVTATGSNKNYTAKATVYVEPAYSLTSNSLCSYNSTENVEAQVTLSKAGQLLSTSSCASTSLPLVEKIYIVKNGGHCYYSLDAIYDSSDIQILSGIINNNKVAITNSFAIDLPSDAEHPVCVYIIRNGNNYYYSLDNVYDSTDVEIPSELINGNEISISESFKVPVPKGITLATNKVTGNNITTYVHDISATYNYQDVVYGISYSPLVQQEQLISGKDVELYNYLGVFSYTNVTNTVSEVVELANYQVHDVVYYEVKIENGYVALMYCPNGVLKAIDNPASASEVERTFLVCGKADFACGVSTYSDVAIGGLFTLKFSPVITLNSKYTHNAQKLSVFKALQNYDLNSYMKIDAIDADFIELAQNGGTTFEVHVFDALGEEIANNAYNMFRCIETTDGTLRYIVYENNKYKFVDSSDELQNYTGANTLTYEGVTYNVKIMLSFSTSAIGGSAIIHAKYENSNIENTASIYANYFVQIDAMELSLNAKEMPTLKQGDALVYTKFVYENSYVSTLQPTITFTAVGDYYEIDTVNNEPTITMVKNIYEVTVPIIIQFTFGSKNYIYATNFILTPKVTIGNKTNVGTNLPQIEEQIDFTVSSLDVLALIKCEDAVNLGLLDSITLVDGSDVTTYKVANMSEESQSGKRCYLSLNTTNNTININFTNGFSVNSNVDITYTFKSVNQMVNVLYRISRVNTAEGLSVTPNNTEITCGTTVNLIGTNGIMSSVSYEGKDVSTNLKFAVSDLTLAYINENSLEIRPIVTDVETSFYIYLYVSYVNSDENKYGTKEIPLKLKTKGKSTVWSNSNSDAFPTVTGLPNVITSTKKFAYSYNNGSEQVDVGYTSINDISSTFNCGIFSITKEGVYSKLGDPFTTDVIVYLTTEFTLPSFHGNAGQKFAITKVITIEKVAPKITIAGASISNGDTFVVSNISNSYSISASIGTISSNNVDNTYTTYVSSCSNNDITFSASFINVQIPVEYTIKSAFTNFTDSYKVTVNYKSPKTSYTVTNGEIDGANVTIIYFGETLSSKVSGGTWYYYNGSTIEEVASTATALAEGYYINVKNNGNQLTQTVYKAVHKVEFKIGNSTVSSITMGTNQSLSAPVTFWYDDVERSVTISCSSSNGVNATISGGTLSILLTVAGNHTLTLSTTYNNKPFSTTIDLTITNDNGNINCELPYDGGKVYSGAYNVFDITNLTTNTTSVSVSTGFGTDTSNDHTYLTYNQYPAASWKRDANSHIIGIEYTSVVENATVTTVTKGITFTSTFNITISREGYDITTLCTNVYEGGSVFTVSDANNQYSLLVNNINVGNATNLHEYKVELDENDSGKGVNSKVQLIYAARTNITGNNMVFWYSESTIKNDSDSRFMGFVYLRVKCRAGNGGAFDDYQNIWVPVDLGGTNSSSISYTNGYPKSSKVITIGDAKLVEHDTMAKYDEASINIENTTNENNDRITRTYNVTLSYSDSKFKLIFTYQDYNVTAGESTNTDKSVSSTLEASNVLNWECENALDCFNSDVNGNIYTTTISKYVTIKGYHTFYSSQTSPLFKTREEGENINPNLSVISNVSTYLIYKDGVVMFKDATSNIAYSLEVNGKEIFFVQLTTQEYKITFEALTNIALSSSRGNVTITTDNFKEKLGTLKYLETTGAQSIDVFDNFLVTFTITSLNEKALEVENGNVLKPQFVLESTSVTLQIEIHFLTYTAVVYADVIIEPSVTIETPSLVDVSPGEAVDFASLFTIYQNGAQISINNLDGLEISYKLLGEQKNEQREVVTEGSGLSAEEVYKHVGELLQLTIEFQLEQGTSIQKVVSISIGEELYQVYTIEDCYTLYSGESINLKYIHLKIQDVNGYYINGQILSEEIKNTNTEYYTIDNNMKLTAKKVFSDVTVTLPLKVEVSTKVYSCPIDIHILASYNSENSIEKEHLIVNTEYTIEDILKDLSITNRFGEDAEDEFTYKFEAVEGSGYSSNAILNGGSKLMFTYEDYKAGANENYIVNFNVYETSIIYIIRNGNNYYYSLDNVYDSSDIQISSNSIDNENNKVTIIEDFKVDLPSDAEHLVCVYIIENDNKYYYSLDNVYDSTDVEIPNSSINNVNNKVTIIEGFIVTLPKSLIKTITINVKTLKANRSLKLNDSATTDIVTLNSGVSIISNLFNVDNNGVLKYEETIPDNLSTVLRVTLIGEYPGITILNGNIINERSSRIVSSDQVRILVEDIETKESVEVTINVNRGNN